MRSVHRTCRVLLMTDIFSLICKLGIYTICAAFLLAKQFTATYKKTSL